MMLLPSLLVSLLGGRPGRSSNAHIGRAQFHRVRLRAGGRPGRSLSPLFEQPLKPRLNLLQSLAQVGLKNIGLGLHHHALGLELVFEQHQLGE